MTIIFPSIVVADIRKRIIIEAREIYNKGSCTEEVWGYGPLTNDINARGYLYLYWYCTGAKGTLTLHNLGSDYQSTWLLTRKRSMHRREKHRQRDRFKVRYRLTG